MPELLTTGKATVIAGTTPDVTIDLFDNDGTALVKASITSLTLTIHDADGNVINSRTATNINDTGIGSLVDVVVGAVTVVRVTIKPTASDTAYQGSADVVESHYWKVIWGWTDAASVARTAGEVYEIKIERLPPTV